MKRFRIYHDLCDYIVCCDSVLTEGNITMFLDNTGKIVSTVSGNYVVKRID
ncbi:hypothetical protein HOS95_gp14 [Salmonella phage vB_SpuP_Spp16]|uniref:Uncharacterized protein n=1 Tax=Salmonella phage vB_SpuP_Spp16 TaxID=2081603 RepID=A0A2P1A4I1_9CAUD|nr:hypothetical protein HOS95_gp14 [Salmonella phage vB_SpuP_Spp16]AVI05045.1 hypothetical protein [Salmonella phage vB_SpuP_Spp16]